MEYNHQLETKECNDMKSQTQNRLFPSLTAFAAALLVCGAVSISAAEEDFTTLVNRLQQQPAVRNNVAAPPTAKATAAPQLAQRK